jgi:hypothetical protein
VSSVIKEWVAHWEPSFVDSPHCVSWGYSAPPRSFFFLLLYNHRTRCICISVSWMDEPSIFVIFHLIMCIRSGRELPCLLLISPILLHCR